MRLAVTFNGSGGAKQSKAHDTRAQARRIIYSWNSVAYLEVIIAFEERTRF